MTALTTIVGLIPMAFGSTAIVGIPYAPLGRSLMGGMLFSTVLTLVVVPVAYSVLDDLRNWFYRLSGLGGDKEAEGAEVSDAAG
jgi:HAE1 family hydrophobic/amphiphilic exporter-1